MLVAKELSLTPRPKANKPYRSLYALCSRIAWILRALVAGMVMSKDYRHLNGMTDRQLRRLGITRNDIPKELRRRHLKNLGGFSNLVI